MAWNFLKGIGIFPKMNVSLKNGLHLLLGALDTVLLKVSPGCMPSEPPKPTLTKWREAYWCCFLDLAFSLPPSSWKFFCRRPCI